MIKIMLELPEDVWDVLEREAVLNGFKREFPTRRWNDGERRQAVRYAIMNRLPA